jgi:hypothetical protein
VVFAVPTYGASLVISPNARKLAKGVLGVRDEEGGGSKRLEE